MAHIKIVKGLNIPISGQPIKKMGQIPNPKQLALDLKSFDEISFKLLAKEGDLVKIGQPLAEDKNSPGRLFVSPAAGIISEVRRGLKRRLEAIIIDVSETEEFHEYPLINPEIASKEEIKARLLNGGIFTLIHQRPFNILANPNNSPKSIFVKAIESAPFVPAAELQVEGYEKEFQAGLTALSKLTDGKVHLVYSAESKCAAFLNAKGVEKHDAIGPHPIANSSLHIQKIDPIQTSDDIIWTLNVHDVISIGHLLTKGKYFTTRLISVAGEGIEENARGFYKVRNGTAIKNLLPFKSAKSPLRFISGDPLMGKKVEENDFLGFNDFVFCSLPESEDREFLHFFRLGKNKYSMSAAYLSGHLAPGARQYDFNTNLHGEPRPFIVASMYDKVQPLNISTMLLVKAVMAEDFELAENLGLLEVDEEDFALPTFVCPSKMEMTEIMANGIKRYSKELLS